MCKEDITGVLHVAKYIDGNDRLCHHNCLFCMERMEPYGSNGILPQIADIDNALHNCVSKGKVFSRIYIAGGEPTLRDDFMKIVDLVRNYCSVIILSSSCDYEIESYMTKLIISSGIKNIATSLHGYKAVTHDALTCSQGSYERTISVMRKLISAGLSVTVNSVICAMNIKEMPLLPFLFRENDLGIKKLTFTHYMCHGNAFYHDELRFNIDDYSNVVSDTLEKCSKVSFEVTFRDFPFCLDERLASHQEKLDDVYIIFPDSSNTVRKEAAPKFVKGKCSSCHMYTDCPKYLLANYGGTP